MDDAGRQHIKQMIFEGQSHEQIREEMVFRGYISQEVEMELDRANSEAETPPSTSGSQVIDDNEIPSAFQNLSVGEIPQVLSKRRKKYCVITLAIISFISLIYLYYPENMGSGEPLISNAELDALWANCQDVQAKYQMLVPSEPSGFYGNEALLSDLIARKKQVENCYANYSVMSGDYSYCDKMPQYENNVMNPDNAKCYLKISSLNGDEKVCEKLAKIDKYACYAGIARYSGDASYCDKIPLDDTSAASKVQCVLDMVNEENYDHLCVSILPCTNCRVSTFIAISFASCFADVAYKAGNNEICGEALGFDDLCYGQLAAYKKDISLCEKAGRIKNECMASLSAVDENATVRFEVNVS